MMKKVIKITTIVTCLFATSSSFAISNTTLATIKLLPNKDGYKLKTVANLSDLPSFDGIWYPDIYSTDELKTITDEPSAEGYDSFEVNNGIVYRLVQYRQYSQYSHKLEYDNFQLRLCSFKIGGMKWDCSMLVDSNQSGYNYSSSYGRGRLIPSPDGDKITGIFTTSNHEQIIFEYNPQAGNMIKTDGIPFDVTFYGNVYAKQSVIYTVSKTIDLSTKTASFYSDSSSASLQIFSNDYGCYYNAHVKPSLLSDGNPYTFYNKRLYSVGGSPQLGYTLDKQIGEYNSVFSSFYDIAGGVDRNIQLYGDKIFAIGGERDNKLSIYYLPKVAESTQRWNALQLTTSNNSEVSFSRLGLINSQNKIYIATPIRDKSYNQKIYLFEIFR